MRSARFAVLVLYSLQVLGLSEVGFGLLLAVGALGGIAGATGAGRWSPRLPLRWLIASTLALSALTQLALGLTSSAVIAVGLIALSSLAFGIWNVVTVTLRQRIAPEHLLGRVHATYRSVAMGAAPLGATVGGVAAAQLGVRAAFLIGVPLLAIGTVAAVALLGPTATDGDHPG